MKKTISDKIITEEVLDKKLEEWAQKISEDINSTFYSKFDESDDRWKDNSRRWEENNRKWAEQDKKWAEQDKKWAEQDKKWDRMFTLQDRILKELVDMREENAASILHFERNDLTLRNHEKRITKLETKKN